MDECLPGSTVYIIRIVENRAQFPAEYLESIRTPRTSSLQHHLALTPNIEDLIYLRPRPLKDPI